MSKKNEKEALKLIEGMSTEDLQILLNYIHHTLWDRRKYEEKEDD